MRKKFRRRKYISILVLFVFESHKIFECQRYKSPKRLWYCTEVKDVPKYIPNGHPWPV